MEYDPASPTDEPELPVDGKFSAGPDLDLSTIPLPGPPVAVNTPRMFDTSICDIPLPPTSMDAASIPLPPSTKITADPPIEVQKTEIDAVQLAPPEPDTQSDISSGPLKFTLKVTSKHLSGQDVPSEASGVFESSKDSKQDEPRPMPKLQALMKRSKPSQLPVGVLPSKTKLPATEAKTELFLPTKETEVTTASSALAEAAKVIQTLSGVSSSVTTNSNARISMETTELSVANEGSNHSHFYPSVTSSLASMSETPALSQAFSSVISESHPNSLLGMSAPLHLQNLNASVPIVSVPVTTIPNLMSLTVQPVQTLVTAPAAAMMPDPTLILRQSKMNMANMQYVNPQKLRSAQMIATPLIANPAVAAQSHQIAEQAKEARKRSRSRSRRRSSSRHRSGQRYRSHRRHSSSSTDGSPRYSSRRRQRRSRSRKSSEERRSRDRTYQRDRDRSRRVTERRREKTSENNGKHSQRDNKLHRDVPERRASSKTPKDDSRIRQRSRSRDPSTKEKPHREREDVKPDRRVPDRSKDKSVRSRESPRTKDQRVDKNSPRSTSNRRSENHKSRDGESRSSQPEQVPKRSRPESEKVAPKPVPRSATEQSKKQDTRSQQRKVLSSRSDSDSSASSHSVSPKKSKRPVPAKRVAEKAAVSKRVVSDEDSDTSSSSSASKISKSSPKVNSKVSRRQSNSQDENGNINKSKSLSTRESELLSASLHSKNAGIGLDCELGSHPVTPDDHGAGCVLSVQSESDSMDISSDSETLDTEAVGTPADKVLTFETDLQITCTQPKEPVIEDLLSGADQEVVRSPANCTEHVPIPEGVDSNSAECIVSTGKTPVSTLPNGNVEHPTDAPRVEFKYDLRARKSKCQKDPLIPSGGCLTPVQPHWFRSNETSDKIFDTFSDAPKPKYTHITDNDYTSVDANDAFVAHSKQFNLTSASLLGSAGLTSNVTHREMRRWVCDCAAPTTEELELGLFSCGPGCINRALNIECGSLCPAGRFCSNRQFQERFYAPTEPFYSGPGKGWGLRATEDILKHMFIIEYVGEVINFAEFRRRVRRYEKLGHAHHYFMALESDRFIDAGSKGNWARFVNHSCEPNCVTQKWSVDGRIRIGFFAKEEIKAGDEITIDYQFVQFGVSEQKCYCGTRSCSGIMGATSKHLQDKVRLKDTTMVERRVIQLLQCPSFQSAEDITLLLQVMVQECLTRYTRLELLKRLANTETSECLKLFRQYNGLDMLAAFMCDSDLTDWELKRQILICLANIPVSEQKQVQTNSRLMEIVTQWTVDPRFCRPRGSGVCSNSATPNSPSTHMGSMRDSPGYASADTCESNVSMQNQKFTSHESSQAPVTVAPTDAPKSNPPNPDGISDDSPAFQSTSVPDFPTIHDPSPKVSATSCLSSPVSTQSPDPDRRITRSASASVIPRGPWSRSADGYQSFTEKPFTDTGNASIGSTQLVVDVETGELEPSLPSTERNEPDAEQQPVQVSEEEMVREIRRLSQDLIEKWSKLPKENYRIPRVERQETEKLLHASIQTDSSLVSWGHVEDHDMATSSWSQSSDWVSAAHRSKRSDMDSASHGSRAPIHTPSLISSTERCADKLSKLERRKLFEAQVIAAEAKKVDISTDEVSPDRTDTQEADRLRQLLLCTLFDELRKASSSSTEKPNNSTGSNGDNTAVLMNTLIQTLPHILSKITNSEDTAAIARLCEEMTRQLKHSENPLPAGWQSAVDPTGKTYYYNMETKVVQWEKPTAADSSDKSSVTKEAETKSINPATMDAETRKRLRKEFTMEVGNYVLKLLRPYRLPNCVTGRIESDGDLVHITRKLTHAFISKELDRSMSKHVPSLNQALQDRIRSSLTRYMMSRGTVYKRRKKTIQSEGKAVEDKGSDNSVTSHAP